MCDIGSIRTTAAISGQQKRDALLCIIWSSNYIGTTKQNKQSYTLVRITVYMVDISNNSYCVVTD